VNPTSSSLSKTGWTRHTTLPDGGTAARAVQRVYLARALNIWCERPGVGLLRAIEARLLGSLDTPRPILDVGCGDGKFAAVLNHELDLGLDLDFRALIAARSTGMYKALLQADICRAGMLPTAQFGTVFGNSVFEHVPDLDAALTGVHRLLAPGGIFAITVPTDKYGGNTLMASLYRQVGAHSRAAAYERILDDSFDHRRRLPVDGWASQLLKAGFVIRDVQLCWSRPTMQAWDFLQMVAKLGIGRYRLNAALARMPKAIQRPLAMSWLKLLSPVYDWDLERATHGGSGGNVLIVAAKP